MRAAARRRAREIQAGHSELAQRLAQSPCVGGFGFVMLKELRPARGLGWLTATNRRQDRNPDGVGYLVALLQTAVIAAERQRDDDPDQRASQDARPAA